jgi:hypothetical protein
MAKAVLAEFQPKVHKIFINVRIYSCASSHLHVYIYLKYMNAKNVARERKVKRAGMSVQALARPPVADPVPGDHKCVVLLFYFLFVCTYIIFHFEINVVSIKCITNAPRYSVGTQ